MEIIVAANGCRDATVEIAKTAAPDATVLDLPQGSKTGAINAANDAASHFPRIYVDADVECSYATIMALVEALEEPGSMTAAPAIQLNLEKADWMVRAYYRVWLKQPYANSGNGGAGCYALSREALEEVGSFPEIIGDDIWIHTRFAKSQKRYVPQDNHGKPVFTIVYPPQRGIEQIRVEARRQIGNAQVLRLHPSPHNIQSAGGGALRFALSSGAGLFDIATHFGMKLASRLLARWNSFRGNGTMWVRDLSSRQVQ